MRLSASWGMFIGRTAIVAGAAVMGVCVALVVDGVSVGGFSALFGALFYSAPLWIPAGLLVAVGLSVYRLARSRTAR